MMKFLVWRLKHIRDNNFLLIVASIIGLIAGLAAVILKTSVHFIQELLRLNNESTDFQFIYLIYPAIGLLLTVAMRRFFFKDTSGHGISRILRAISKTSSRIRKRYMVSNMFKSAMTVGFGGSVGLEAPIVVTGSAIGSNIGQLVHLDYKKRTVLIGCGAAGAISAIFNSPIAGVIFAIEVILTEVTISKFIPILIASVSGQLVALFILGSDALFNFRNLEAFNANHTPFYILLGIFCGLVSLYFTRMVYATEAGVQKIDNDFLRAFLGGIGLAILIFIFPPVYGEGYDTIKDLLMGLESELYVGDRFENLLSSHSLLILILLLIILVKPVATAITIGSGGSGGVFAPSLFMGAVTGYFFAKVVGFVWPAVEINTTNFTLVAMSGVMSGVLNAPLTAIFLIAEITGGYTLFVPLMLVSALSFSTISYFEKGSIYTKKLFESGELVTTDKDRLVLNQINIKKMIEKDLLKIHPDAKLSELVALVKKSRRNIFPVVDEKEELMGIVTLDDIRDKMFDKEYQENVVVKSIMHKPPGFVSSNEKMQSVMNKFQLTQAWNLPVIDDGKYVGFVSKSRIFNAYRMKLIRQSKE